jgi:hypothetical protein
VAAGFTPPMAVSLVMLPGPVFPGPLVMLRETGILALLAQVGEVEDFREPHRVRSLGWEQETHGQHRGYNKSGFLHGRGPPNLIGDMDTHEVEKA